MKRIHIVGSGPRTGTTLLAEVMHTCFDIDNHCEHEAPLCIDEPDHGDIFLTKEPGEICTLKWPLKLNNNLYSICIIRDPRDSIVSYHGKRLGEYWTGLRYWKEFVKIFPKLSTHPRFIYFTYEDFVHDPDRIQEMLIDRMPFLKPKCKFSDYHKFAKPSEDSVKALKSVRPIVPVGLGKWRQHLPRVKHQVKLHGSISKELIYFGYEENTDWELQLNGIDAIEYTQSRPQFIRLRDRLKNRGSCYVEVINILLRKAHINPRVVKKPFTRLYVFMRELLKPAFNLFGL